MARYHVLYEKKLKPFILDTASRIYGVILIIHLYFYKHLMSMQLLFL